jgi:hypothetical protein
MIVKLFAVYDSVSGVYDGPVSCQNEGVALRSFSNVARNPETQVGQHPEHYSLWLVGTWNDADGSIVSEGKECLTHAVDILREDA